MDPEKPFKTIEVVDARTNQVCKVACMSCIRGHRTTSCGIPVCRTKIFWTVKRPGRPSNSCTCRFGATGGCKCVVAKSACPHKPKKGEKRSGECRCDEQGRYCCLLEPDHWAALMSLQKPAVDFFSSREGLEAQQMGGSQPSFPSTPGYVASSPALLNSVPTTPGHGSQIHPHIRPAPYHAYSPSSTTLTPRFGMMGIGGPPRTLHDTTPDLRSWEGLAPQDFNPTGEASTIERGSCCGGPASSIPSLRPSTSGLDPAYTEPQPMPDLSLPPGYRNPLSNTHDTTITSILPPAPAPEFDFSRLQADYFHYQFPSAICQNCGLSGCTCKNCPPVFQNYGTGSWAQCCGRKHARDRQPSPGPQKIARTGRYEGSQDVHVHVADDVHARAPLPSSQPSGCCGGQASPLDSHTLPSTIPTPPPHPPPLDLPEFYPVDHDLPPPGSHADFPPFELDHAFLLPAEPDTLDLNEFLLSDLEDPRQESTDDPPAGDDGPGPGATDGGGGGGGCCCGDDT